MMPKEELERWLGTLQPGQRVGVDEGGLTLMAVGKDACLEVGGFEPDAAEMLFLNYYTCPTCEHEWTDSWDCTCDDDCPSCGERHISPTHSEDLRPVKAVELTVEQKERYVKERSGHCPYCDEIDIAGGHIEVDGNSAWQNITCSVCNRTWDDIYTLTDIAEDPA